MKLASAETAPSSVNNRPIAYSPKGVITAARFAADVRHVTAQIEATVPECRHVLNICADRYHFIVGLTAALLSNRISLLPSSQTAETVAQMRAFKPDLFCMEDGGESTIQIPGDMQVLHISCPEETSLNDSNANASLPPIPPDRVAAYVFTSGSTGTQVAHCKTWSHLVLNTAASTDQLGLSTNPHSIVATVPPQHMYGFESTVLLNLLGHCPVWSGRPFYPADIAAALAAVPRPRLLVTTPFHLRNLLDSDIAIPPVDCILSATAPLPESLARQAEAKLGAPLQEIYGCTETGQIATRRLTQSSMWSLMRDIELRPDDDGVIASGGHIEGEIRLGDVIELHPERQFQLLGRHTDLINIAGKRTTIGYLNQQLLAIPGVEDGSFYMPDDSKSDQSAHITRICAIVVAPGLSQRHLLDALRQRIDAIFMPRPLIVVDQLPRNSTGKLPRAALAEVHARHAAQYAARQAAPVPTAES